MERGGKDGSQTKGLLEFVKNVFDATEIENMSAPDGAIMHAEAKIGDSIIMMSDARDPHQPTTAAVYLYLPDVDATYKHVEDVSKEELIRRTHEMASKRK